LTRVEAHERTRLQLAPSYRGLAGLLDLTAWLQPLFVTVFVIAVVSGVQYVWIWGAKARRERATDSLKLH